MKKSKLLILFPIMGLFLSGCTFQEGLQSTKSWINSHIYQPLKSFFSSSSTPAPSEEGKKEEEKKEEEKKEEGKSFSFADWEKDYADQGFSGVKIPEYKCASSSATITQPYAEEAPYYYVVKGSSVDEMKAFVQSFSSDWEAVVDNYGDYDLYFGGDLEEGESCPDVYVGDYTAESAAGIVVAFYTYTQPYSAVPNAVISEDLQVTISLPEYTGTKYGYYYDDSTTQYGPSLTILVTPEGEAAAVTEYEGILTGAGFTVQEDEESGSTYYVSSSGEYKVEVYEYYSTWGVGAGQVYVDIYLAE